MIEPKKFVKGKPCNEYGIEELIPFVEEYWDCENNQTEKFSSPEEVLEKAKEKGWEISSYDYNAIYHSFGMKSPLEELVEEVKQSRMEEK